MVKYRYCVFVGGKFSRWENDVGFRSISPLRQGVKKEILDTFNSAEDVEPVVPAETSPIGIRTSFRAAFAELSKKSANDISLTGQDGVIIVSYFLPVILNRSPLGQWSASWDRENVLALDLPARSTWVGCVRYSGGTIGEEDEEAVAEVLQRINCYPIFLTQSEHHQFYDLFCKRYLWPLLHQVADVYGPLNLGDIDPQEKKDLWFIYSKVNQKFRARVVEVFQPGDLIWIHGFHLMVLPSFLRNGKGSGMLNAKIGYFFHTPFPSTQIWRTLSLRDELARGVLSADLVGFHLYEYARHFKAMCHRMLGYTTEINSLGRDSINVDGREVVISCMHVGVDLPHVNEILASKEFEVEMSQWRDKFKDKIVISGTVE